MHVARIMIHIDLHKNHMGQSVFCYRSFHGDWQSLSRIFHLPCNQYVLDRRKHKTGNTSKDKFKIKTFVSGGGGGGGTC